MFLELERVLLQTLDIDDAAGYYLGRPAPVVLWRHGCGLHSLQIYVHCVMVR